MNIGAVFENSSNLINTSITIEGWLFSGESTFVASERDAASNESSILNVSHEIQELLLDCVPVYVGGKYLYHDECEITGVLRGNIDGSLTIEPVILKVCRGPDETFTIEVE